MRTKTKRRIVHIAALIGAGILLQTRNDWPLASIVLIVAIADFFFAIQEGHEDRKKGGIRRSFTSVGAQTVRDGFKSIGNEVRGESEEARRFRQDQTTKRLESLKSYVAVPTTMVTTDVDARYTSTSKTTKYNIVGVDEKKDETTTTPKP